LKTTLTALLLTLTLLASTAWGRVVLQNDSIMGGDEIAFYASLQGGESFISIFDVPDDHPEYQICRVLLWIGPGGSNIFTVRIDEADDAGELTNLVWQSDLDAYQVFGSVEQMSSIDVANQRIRADARRLRVRIRHVEGQNAPPGIASDADGITAGHNLLSVLLRNGRRFQGFSEDLEVDGTPPRPPGDWILRLEIVNVDEACPGGAAPLPDAGAPQPPRDAGLPSEPDANVPIGGSDATELDAGVADAAPITRDAARPSDMRTPQRDAGELGALELTRIAPGAGPADRNTEVVINGRGFPVNGQIFAEVGPERLLELEVLSGSTITGIVPAGLASGAHDLRLTRGDGQVAILPTAFTVVGESLALTDVSPSRITQNAPAEMTVQGIGFTNTTRFSVAGVLIEDVIVDSPQEARGTLFASMPLGTYDLVARSGDEVARLQGGVEVVAAGGADGGLGGRSGAPSSGGCMTTDREAPLGASWWACLLILMVARRRLNS
jgi:hypothetical protein